MSEEVVIFHNNVLFQFSGHINDLVLDKLKFVLNREMLSLLGLLDK